jgi:hypothetical protein
MKPANRPTGWMFRSLLQTSRESLKFKAICIHLRFS